MVDSDVPEVRLKVSTRDKDVPWYTTSIGEQLGPAARDLLEKYARLAPEEVESHIYKIREQAWEVWPYPCIGRFRFLELSLSLSPYYPTLLSRLQSGNEILLDLGCCFGQEIRKLVADGAPSAQIYGSDLEADFYELGYELFQDRDTLKSKFIAADIMDEASALNVLDGKVDAIYVGAFLHLFDYEGQVKVCERIVKLLTDKKDSVVLGLQVGNVIAGAQPEKRDPAENMYRHNEESFKRMWEEVGEKTNTKWRVETDLRETGAKDNSSKTWHDSNMRRLRFTVFRD